MPQHAVTNGYMKSEYFRAQPSSASSRRRGKPLIAALEDAACVVTRVQFSHSSAPFFQQ